MLYRLERVVLRLDFLAALALLGLNDHVWKAAYPGWVTGKLSDVAGVYAFGLFCVALWPERRGRVLAAIAAGFALWKSPLAQPFIDAWNASPLWPVGRVVDLTDLYALLVLLLVRTHTGPNPSHRPVWTALSSAAALGLFMATSLNWTTIPIQGDYAVPEAFLKALEPLDGPDGPYTPSFDVGEVLVNDASRFSCNGYATAPVYPNVAVGTVGVTGCGQVYRDASGPRLRLDSVRIQAEGMWGGHPTPARARTRFEQQVVVALAKVSSAEWASLQR